MTDVNNLHHLAFAVEWPEIKQLPNRLLFGTKETQIVVDAAFASIFDEMAVELFLEPSTWGNPGAEPSVWQVWHGFL
jgi:hypothetical protein